MKDNQPDIRWRQRLQHLEKAYAELKEACQKTHYSKLERGGLIQAFEFTFELSWKTLQDVLDARGYSCRGPRPVIEQAFQDALIEQGLAWTKMLLSRNMTTHSYHEETAEAIAQLIKTQYESLLGHLIQKLHTL